jgi:hypothetical protein
MHVYVSYAGSWGGGGVVEGEIHEYTCTTIPFNHLFSHGIEYTECTTPATEGGGSVHKPATDNGLILRRLTLNYATQVTREVTIYVLSCISYPRSTHSIC